MAVLPYLTEQLTSSNRGYFAKAVEGVNHSLGHSTEKDSYGNDSTMYYNGSFQCARVFNAVWNDYAEKFYTPTPLKAGEILATETVYIGVCTETYGRCLGQGNTAICMTGRVPLKVNTSKLKGGEYLYWNNGKNTGTWVWKIIGTGWIRRNKWNYYWPKGGG